MYKHKQKPTLEKIARKTDGRLYYNEDVEWYLNPISWLSNPELRDDKSTAHLNELGLKAHRLANMTVDAARGFLGSLSLSEGDVTLLEQVSGKVDNSERGLVRSGKYTTENPEPGEGFTAGYMRYFDEMSRKAELPWKPDDNGSEVAYATTENSDYVGRNDSDLQEWQKPLKHLSARIQRSAEGRIVLLEWITAAAEELHRGQKGDNLDAYSQWIALDTQQGRYIGAFDQFTDLKLLKSILDSTLEPPHGPIQVNIGIDSHSPNSR